MGKDFLKNFESKIVRRRPGFLTWFDALPPQAKDSLGKIKAKYDAGGYRGTAKRALAKAVIEIASENGWATSGEQGVVRWLESKT